MTSSCRPSRPPMWPPPGSGTASPQGSLKFTFRIALRVSSSCCRCCPTAGASPCSNAFYTSHDNRDNDNDTDQRTAAGIDRLVLLVDAPERTPHRAVLRPRGGVQGSLQ